MCCAVPRRKGSRRESSVHSGKCRFHFCVLVCRARGYSCVLLENRGCPGASKRFRGAVPLFPAGLGSPGESHWLLCCPKAAAEPQSPGSFSHCGSRTLPASSTAGGCGWAVLPQSGAWGDCPWSPRWQQVHPRVELVFPMCLYCSPNPALQFPTALSTRRV